MSSSKANMTRTAIASAAAIMIAGIGFAALSQTQQMDIIDGAIPLSNGVEKVADFEEISDSAPASNTGQQTVVSIDDNALDAASLQEDFELSRSQAAEIAALPASEQTQAIISALEGNPAFDVVRDGDGNITVERPFLLKRIVVPGQASDVSAVDAAGSVYDETSDAYYLTFDTMADTAAAYEKLSATVGEDNIIIDVPVQLFGTSNDYTGWGTNQMNLGAVEDELDASGGGSPVTVAVIDSGARASHAAFSGVNFDSNSGSFLNARSSASTVSKDFSDGHGHGTHVSGIVAASTPDSVSIMELKAMDSSGAGSLADVYYAVLYAANKGAKVINLSLGGNLADANGNVSPALKSTANTFDKALKKVRDSGVSVIAAASNEGKSIEQLYTYPAISEYVTSVGALNSSLNRAGYSNYGQSLDFVAPGSYITSAFKSDDTAAITMSGTSMAAPHISAFAADLLSIYPDLTPDEIVEKMKEMSIDLGDKGFDVFYGYGEPQFDLSLLAKSDEPASSPADEPANEPAEEPSNEQVDEPTPANEPANEPVNEHAEEPAPANEPVNEPVDEPADEPVNEPTPTNEPANEPTGEPSPVRLYNLAVIQN